MLSVCMTGSPSFKAYHKLTIGHSTTTSARADSLTNRTATLDFLLCTDDLRADDCAHLDCNGLLGCEGRLSPSKPRARHLLPFFALLGASHSVPHGRLHAPLRRVRVEK